MKTLIIGAGPVGLAAALALRHANADGEIVLLEAAAKGSAPFSDRNIALSLATWRSLARVGVRIASDAPRASIRGVDITQQGVFGLLRLRADDVGESELGAAMPYPDLKAALDTAVAQTAIEVMWNAKAVRIELIANHAVVHLETGEALTADCVVIADGANEASLMPSFKHFERDSGQVAVIAKVRPTKPTAGVAYERFTQGGALALIPRAAKAHESLEWTLVWARANAEATRLLECDEDTFAHEINAAFGATMGELNVASKRSSYPLVWRFVEPRASGCVVAIGNAAQGLHPVAAQGLNLGLRDAMQLAEALAGNANISQAFASFARARAMDRATSIGFTGLLAYGFDRGGWLLDAPRGLALTAVQLLPPLRREIIRRLAM